MMSVWHANEGQRHVERVVEFKPVPPADALYPEPHVLSHERLNVLDGWRAISILAVLAGHLLPLNAVLHDLNEATAATGMAVFFTLSGFLITRFLLDRPEAQPFLIRRLLRILPLGWLAMLVLYIGSRGQPDAFERLLANMLFFANLPPQHLFEGGSHLWSLCVEMQFYVAAAVIVIVGGRRGLYALPLLGLAVTGARIAAGAKLDIVTWYRVDEILAGAALSLLYAGRFGPGLRAAFMRFNFWIVATVAAACCYFIHTPLAYARPYAVAALVGVTLFHSPALVHRWLTSRTAAYIAEISYALYVFHWMLNSTWLGSGGPMEKYPKRPLLLGATFLLAHLSTYHFERHFIQLAKRLTPRRAPAPAASTVVAEPPLAKEGYNG
jgi:peptidoglycan/LPS O-acetylase OafA/YrhL